jgi:hypothetical protein
MVIVGWSGPLPEFLPPGAVERQVGRGVQVVFQHVGGGVFQGQGQKAQVGGQFGPAGVVARA